MSMVFKTRFVNFPYSKKEYAHFLKSVYPKIEHIEGFLDKDEAFFLYYTARNLGAKKRARNIVEIGSFKGKSTVALALGLSDNPIDGFTVHSIDPFIGDPATGLKNCRKDYENNIHEAGVAHLVNIISKPSAKAVLEWPEDKEIAFLFIDGNHRYEHAAKDHQLWSQYVIDNDGIVAFHDIHMSGVHEAIIKKMLTRTCYQRFALVIRTNDLNNGLLIGYRRYYSPNILGLFEKSVIRLWLKVGGGANSIRLFYSMYSPLFCMMRNFKQLVNKFLR